MTPTQTINITALGLHPGQLQVWNNPARFKMIAAGRRWGKALALETPIITPFGWTTMGDLRVGDYVYSESGKPTEVIFVSDVMTGHECFKLTFSDCATIVADANHMWETETARSRKQLGRGGSSSEPKLHTTQAILETLDEVHSIRVCGPLDNAPGRLLIPPYTLGAWLGDGNSAGAAITIADCDAPEILASLADEGIASSSINRHPEAHCATYGIGTKAPEIDAQGHFAANGGIQTRLRTLNLLNNKHIPLVYLRASITQRTELLQGLMDTDGSVQEGGHCEFLVVNQELAIGVFELLLTLGTKPTVAVEPETLYGRVLGKRYRISFTPDFPVFSLARKLTRQKTRRARSLQTQRRTIVSVEPVESVPVRCIAVKAASHLFLAGDRLIPTHNTRYGVAQCVTRGLQGQRAWWVAPIYKIAAVGWRQLKAYSIKLPGTKISEVHMNIEFPTGGVIEVRSASDPDSLRGEGLNYLFMDEAAIIQERAWSECLRPALVDKRGNADFGFTPKGKNWVYRQYMRGLPKARNKDDQWASFHFASIDNPHIDPEEIAQTKIQMPERLFRQEHLAEFLDDAGGIIRGVIEAAVAEECKEPQFGHTYVLGVDWGKYEDFTVIIVLDETTHSVVFMDRFNMIDYTIQSDRLKALYQKFKPKVVMAEQNSIGDPIIERLQLDGMKNVVPFKTTHESKMQLINALALAFERGDIKIIPDPLLMDELQAYEATKTEMGMLRYGAPEGMHDDSVIATALAWKATCAPIMAHTFAMDQNYDGLPKIPLDIEQRAKSLQKEMELAFLQGGDEDD